MRIRRVLAWKSNPHRHPILMATIYDIWSIDNCLLGAQARTHSAAQATPMEAAQARLHKAPGWDAGLTRPTRLRTKHLPAKKRARGAGASFKGVRVHPAHKGEETEGRPLSREEAARLPMRALYRRPLMALFQRHRSHTGGVGFAENTGGLYPNARRNDIVMRAPWRAGDAPHTDDKIEIQ